MGFFLKGTHCVVGGLALALILGSSSWHLLGVTIRNVEQNAGALLTAVWATAHKVNTKTTDLCISFNPSLLKQNERV